jgi:hypothetical protein
MKNYGLPVFYKINFCDDKILLFCGNNLVIIVTLIDIWNAIAMQQHEKSKEKEAYYRKNNLIIYF